MPYAMLLSYSAWYAAARIRISLRTRSSSVPRSAEFTTVWRMTSSNASR
jgi:hypothetical protein